MSPLLKSSEFCATCHHSHLMPELNGLKYIKDFSTYDDWQLSSYSSESLLTAGKKTKVNCQHCHMALSSKVEGALITAVFQIKNLLPHEQKIIWFADDSYHLRIVSKNRSEPLTLTDKPIEVQVQAINAVRDKILDRRSCLFLGCNSLANKPEDFSSGFGYTDGDMLLGLLPSGPAW